MSRPFAEGKGVTGVCGDGNAVGLSENEAILY